MPNENLTLSPQIPNMSDKDDLVFPKEKRFIYSIRASFIFIPYLFLIGLVQLGYFSGSTMVKELDIRMVYIIGLIISLVYFALLIPVFYLVGKIRKENMRKITYQIPLKFFLISLPIFLAVAFWVLVAGEGLNILSMMLIYLLSVMYGIMLLFLIFPGYLVYIWFSGKRKKAMIFYFSGMLLLAFHVFYNVIWGSCFYSDTQCFIEKATSDPEKISYEICQRTQFPGQCIGSLIGYDKSLEPSVCERITLRNSQYSGVYDGLIKDCYMRIADKRDDTAFCDSIKIEQASEKELSIFIQDCKNKMYYRAALATGDVSECGKISAFGYFADHFEEKDYRQECFSEMAIKKDDVNICENADNPLDCTIWYWGSKGRCDMVSGYYAVTWCHNYMKWEGIKEVDSGSKKPAIPSGAGGA